MLGATRGSVLVLAAGGGSSPGGRRGRTARAERTGAAVSQGCAWDGAAGTGAALQVY